MNEGSLSIVSNKHIGHLVNEGESGLIESDDDLCLLPLPLEPHRDEVEFFLLAGYSLVDLFRLERFSSCLRSGIPLLALLALLLFENSGLLFNSTKFCFEYPKLVDGALTGQRSSCCCCCCCKLLLLENWGFWCGLLNCCWLL